MRRFSLYAFGWAVFAASGCSLRSLDDLNRCTGKRDSAGCQNSGAGGSGAQSAAGAAGSAVEGGTSGASGSASGLGGATSGEAGGAGAPAEPELVLLYAYREPDEDETIAESKSLRPIFVIKNFGGEPVDVAELSIRYYYTLENPMPQEFICDFVKPDGAIKDCDGVRVAFGNLDHDTVKNYAEVTFQPPVDATRLIPELGGDSGLIQLRFHKTGFGLQDQTSDYSFDTTKLEVPVPWDRVTLYRDGALVWGIEPG